jgi:hypothetical protein
MKIVDAATFLRRVLFVDAALSSAMALLLIFGASAIASITALPELLLQGAGWILVPWVALVMFTATREPLRAGLVWAVIALNAVWAVESVALLFVDSIDANALGVAFVLAQALAVAVLAALQTMGLRGIRAART